MARRTSSVSMKIDHQHLKLDDLEKEANSRNLQNQYIYKDNIPAYPQPEFHVSNLKHDTGKIGLWGIRTYGGFKDPQNVSCWNQKKRPSLVWWSLSVGEEEMESAEKRLLQTTYPERTEEQAEKPGGFQGEFSQKQGSFLGDFATSPAFLPSSRMGSFRFTFPLEEVLKAYSQQFCSEGDEPTEPVMRVYKTVLYKQEVMYVVLVHSPANQELFSESPLLSDDPDSVVSYRDGRFIWRSQAMCETHRLELIRSDREMLLESESVLNHQFYVWDHVAIALHVGDQVLKFDPDRLRENLSYCEKGKPIINPERDFLCFSEAEELVQKSWPKDPPAPLQKAKALTQGIITNPSDFFACW